MLSFICTGKPRSWKAEGRNRYQEQLRVAFQSAIGEQPADGEGLYGAVYYLKNSAHMLDADNLSKPVWDALKGLAYQDDVCVLLRHAGIVDLRSQRLTQFDLSKLPDEVAEQLMDAVGVEEHVLYVELGSLDFSMFRFGLSGSEVRS